MLSDGPEIQSDGRNCVCSLDKVPWNPGNMEGRYEIGFKKGMFIVPRNILFPLLEC